VIAGPNFFGVFEPIWAKNVDVTVTYVPSVQFKGLRHASPEHLVEMIQYSEESCPDCPGQDNLGSDHTEPTVSPLPRHEPGRHQVYLQRTDSYLPCEALALCTLLDRALKLIHSLGCM
jgi:hypothetical protein